MKINLEGTVMGLKVLEEKEFEINGQIFVVAPHVEIALINNEDLFKPSKIRDFTMSTSDLEPGDIFSYEVEIKGDKIKFDMR